MRNGLNVQMKESYIIFWSRIILQHTEERRSKGGGVVLDLQIEIFTYKFFEGFCREGDEFYANIMM